MVTACRAIRRFTNRPVLVNAVDQDLHYVCVAVFADPFALPPAPDPVDLQVALFYRGAPAGRARGQSPHMIEKNHCHGSALYLLIC